MLKIKLGHLLASRKRIKMKNYLCINGKKTELTKEQMKQLGIIQPVATLSEDGKTATIGEYEFIVLNSNPCGTVELLLKGKLGKDTVFGDNNDFRKSKVKGILDDFAEKIAKLVGAENLIEHNVDLISLDGLDDYGVTRAKMSLLTLAKYQQYVGKLDECKLDDYWWLVTPWSTPTHGYESSVLCVAPSGGLDGIISFCYYSGVRPFCVLKSCIFES